MKKFLVTAWAKISGISKTILSFLLPLLATATATALEQLLPLALDAVASYAASDLAGEEKRKRATDQLRAAALQAGVAASASVINLAVEMAVQKLKEEGQ